MGVIALLVACGVGDSKEATTSADSSPSKGIAVASTSASQPSPTTVRAQQIKHLLYEHRDISGGHSPVPTRVINRTTFDAVRPAIGAGDADALVELALDDAPDLRSAAVYLLADIDPHADQRLRNRMSIETDKTARGRLEDALLDLKVIRASPPPISNSRK